MGKRELLLIVGFALVGVVVYQLTAPAAQPGQERFSLSRLVDELRREVRGNPAHAEVVIGEKIGLDDDVLELRFETSSAELRVTGGARSDIAYELKVRSSGSDEAEARTYAERTKLRLSRSADSLVVSIDYPPEARQWATLTLQVPEHLRVRVQPNRSQLEITNLASVELVEARGTATLRQIPGRVTVTHRGGELIIADVGPLRVNGRGSEVRLSRIAGEAQLQIQSGDLEADALAGPVEIEASNAEIRLTKCEGTQGPVRISTVAGSLSVRGLATEARIDARNTEIEVTVAQAAPIAIYSEGGDDTTITPPPDGYQLDAVVTRGQLNLPEDLKRQVTATPPAAEGDRRATGAVNGGGPTLTLRANRGGITIRPADAARPAH